VTHHGGGGWLTLTNVLVSQANQLLGASYQIYRNVKTNETIIRTVGYALPTVLHTHIQTVAPTMHFPSRRVTRQTTRRRSSEKSPTASGKPVRALSSREIEPAFLRWIYSTGEYVPFATARNRLAVAGFVEDEFPSQEDLTLFMDRFFYNAQAATFTVVQVNGGVNNNPTEMANTEIQYASAMAFPTPVVYYSIGGDLLWGPGSVALAGDAYLEWFNHIFAERNILQTISIAYGDIEQNLPAEYAWAVCRRFLELGAQGVSVLVARRRRWALQRYPGKCPVQTRISFILYVWRFIKHHTSASTSCSPDCHGFAGPWVTSVGGTRGKDPEVAASRSGGGFSTIFPCPRYQFDAVDEFLWTLGNQHAGRFKYARCRDLTFCLLCNLLQLFESCLPRHRSASGGFRIRLRKCSPYWARHALRGFGVYFFTPLLSRSVSSILKHPMSRQWRE
jgi:tripeptidyl-peptidase-1